MSAMGIVIPLIPFFLRDLGMTDRADLLRWSGLVFSAPFLAAATMSPVWGFLGDRFGHKKMVVRAVIGLAIVNLALVFVETPLQFFVLRFTTSHLQISRLKEKSCFCINIRIRQ